MTDQPEPQASGPLPSQMYATPVWRESVWPFQWIGMCDRHPGGIRCNDEQEALRTMRGMCSKHGCGWTRSAATPRDRLEP